MKNKSRIYLEKVVVYLFQKVAKLIQTVFCRKSLDLHNT